MSDTRRLYYRPGVYDPATGMLDWDVDVTYTRVRDVMRAARALAAVQGGEPVYCYWPQDRGRDAGFHEVLGVQDVAVGRRKGRRVASGARQLVVRGLPGPLLRAVEQRARAYGLSTREFVRNAVLLLLDMQEAVAVLMLRSKVRVPPCVWQLAFPTRDQDDRDAHAQYCPLCMPMKEVPDDVSGSRRS